MDLQELQNQFTLWRDEATYAFQKVPGSAVLIRYVRSSYQNDPVRSALELVLVIFVIHYLFAPSYSTKKNEIKLTEAVSPYPRIRTLCSLVVDKTGDRKSMSWLTSGFPSRWLRPRRLLKRQRQRGCLSCSGSFFFFKKIFFSILFLGIIFSYFALPPTT